MSVSLCVLLCSMAFLNGVPLGIVIGFFMRGKKPVSAPVVTPTVEELERIKKEREELRAEQDAFQKILGYSADVAYGLHDNPLEGS